jgi:hypothetical protein
MFRILTEKRKPGLWLSGLLACAVLQAAAASAATITLANTAAVNAIAYDDVANRLYFVDPNGSLQRLQLTPGCEAAPPCQVSTVPTTTGFGVPTDIAVNSAAGLAYVISQDGTLWKVDLKSPAPVMPVKITPGLGVAHLALVPEINSAFVCETRGSLWRVDLSTGDKTVLAHLPYSPQSLIVNAARTFAYVSTGSALGSATINEVDLSTGKVTRTFFRSVPGFSIVDSLAWADSSEHALYALVLNGLGDVNLDRVDLTTAETTLVAHFKAVINDRQFITPVLSLAANPLGSGLYLGGYNSVMRYPLSPIPNGQDVFMSIGNIPSARIIDGLAQTSSIPPDAVFKVADSPFGGTLDIFGDLATLRQTYGATSYQILVQKPGPTPSFVPIQASWTAYRWNQNPSPGHYEPRLVAPIDSLGTYTIPPEYGNPATVPFWSPVFLTMRYPTSDNGLYTFKIQIFGPVNGINKNITFKIPIAQRTLTILVDNTPPVVTLNSVQDKEGNIISPCDIVLPGEDNLFRFGVTVSDPNMHLLDYTLSAQWGRNQSATITSGSFGLNSQGFSPSQLLPADPSNPSNPLNWSASCNCAHLFTLQARKRTIDGRNHILSASSSEAITINNTGKSCP